MRLGEYDSTPTLRNNLVWSLRELGRLDEAIRVCEQLAAGADPTLALIANARLIDMHARTGDPALPSRIDAMLETMVRTDVYIAHATAAKMVLIHGSDVQVDRVLGVPATRGHRPVAARGAEPCARGARPRSACLSRRVRPTRIDAALTPPF